MRRASTARSTLTGYARIDLRLDAEGRVYVLEANPNPQLAYGEDFAESAERSGLKLPRPCWNGFLRWASRGGQEQYKRNAEFGIRSAGRKCEVRSRSAECPRALEPSCPSLLSLSPSISYLPLVPYPFSP